MDEVGKIGIIHGDDEVEVEEIGGGDRTGAVSQLIASGGRGLTHPDVRKFASVSGIGTGGVDQEVRGAAVFVYNSLENSLCRWGTADVPETHKEYLMFIHVSLLL